MKLFDIISGEDPNEFIEEILKRIHYEGPIYSSDLESLSYIKMFQPELFLEYESQLINLLGLFFKTTSPQSVVESVYSIFAESITSEIGHAFTPVQSDAYHKITHNVNFSFAAPTSAGKSYLFRELITRTQGDVVIVVPSRALISEYIHAIKQIEELPKDVLILQFVELVNLAHSKKRIFVITPERGKEIFKHQKALNVDMFLFDEAQISEDQLRGMRFDALVRRVDKHFKDSKKIFAHPFVSNPEAQLKKHNFSLASEAKNYNQMSVGKIYLSVNKDYQFSYFLPSSKGEK